MNDMTDLEKALEILSNRNNNFVATTAIPLYRIRSMADHAAKDMISQRLSSAVAQQLRERLERDDFSIEFTVPRDDIHAVQRNSASGVVLTVEQADFVRKALCKAVTLERKWPEVGKVQ